MKGQPPEAAFPDPSPVPLAVRGACDGEVHPVHAIMRRDIRRLVDE